MRDLERQRRIWEALDLEFGEDARERVGTLLAHTKAEWHVPLEGDVASPKRQGKTKQS